MFVSKFALLLSITALTVSPSSAADFMNVPRCGDCWCITDASDGNTCPTDTTGITDAFSATDELYATFQLTNDPVFLELQSASGGPCYPFAESMGPIMNYPESNEEQCVFPVETDETVCGYVYDNSSPTCEGRKYSIQNFDSTNDAMMSNAAILHKGACGVCSTAQDFGARIKNVGTMEVDSIKCATSYTFTRNFSNLISCYKNLGFTDNCSSLWAHFVATNGSNCAIPCFPDSSGNTQLNGPAPACEPSDCLTCQKDFRADFDKIAGIEFPNAGITERIAHSCNSFYRTIHDPCLGFDPDRPEIEDESSSDAPFASPPVPEVLPEVSSEEGDSAGNHIDTTLFEIATTLTLLVTVVLL